MSAGIHHMLYSETKQALIELEKKIEVAKQKLEDAINLGDLSENAEYEASRSELGKLHREYDALCQIQGIEVLMSSNSDTIEPGCIIHLKLNDGLGQQGSFEGTLLYGGDLDTHFLTRDFVLSLNSPIGKSIQSKRSGETIQVPNCPKGIVSVTVEKIKYNPNDPETYPKLYYRDGNNTYYKDDECRQTEGVS